MNFRFIISLLLCISGVYSFEVPNKDHINNDYFAIELNDDVSLLSIISKFTAWKYEHPARGNPNHFVFSKSKASSDSNVYQFHEEHDLFDEINDDQSTRVLKRQFLDNISSEGIISVHHLPPKRLHKRAPVPIDGKPIDSSLQAVYDTAEQFNIKDPQFQKQWHLLNPSYPGNDVNVTEVWARNITGKGIVTALVDDGLEYEHEDLKDNFNEEGSWDFNSNTKLPKPRLSDDYHGTRCAGEIAAVRNDVCGVGVAYDSKVSGIRILSGEITIEDEAAALVYGLEHNDIYSCSWGPPDNGKSMQAPGALVKKSLIRGVSEGRKGKGAVYVYASGNGAHLGDNCNYDGYTNSIYSITVGALDHKGLHPSYSESCSAVLVVTYSSGSNEHIHSTDFHGRCTDNHGGTSAAAPLAAGIYSLVLSANPELSWRDVQYLTVHTSVKVNDNDGGWQKGAISEYSHKYGYGKLDAFRIVDLAQRWENVNEQVNATTGVIALNKAIPDEFEHDFEVTDDLFEDFKNLEHIVMTFNMDTTNRGQISLDLISPSGIVSNLGVVRNRDISDEGFHNWNFMSVAHWGDEKPQGLWKIKVKNHGEKNKVNFKDFKINFFGQKRDIITEPLSSTIEEVSSSSSSSSSSISEPESTSANEKAPVSQPEPTEGAEDSDDYGQGRYSQPPNHVAEYFGLLMIFGFIVLLVFYKLSSKNNRRRREQYEFDIIRHDSDSDSDIEFDLDNNNDDTSTNENEADERNRLNQSFPEGERRASDDSFQISDDEGGNKDGSK